MRSSSPLKSSALVLFALTGITRAQPSPTPLDELRAALTEASREATADADRWRLVLETEWPRSSPRASALEQLLRDAITDVVPVDDAAPNQLTLRVRVREGRLELRLRSARVATRWWRQLFGWQPPGTDWHRHVPLDPQLRTYVGTTPQLTSGTLVATSTRLPSRGYLALAVAQLDGHGPHELVLVRETQVEVLRLTAGPRGRTRLQLQGRVDLPPDDRPGVGARRPGATTLVEGDSVLIRWRWRLHPMRVRLTDRVVLERAESPCPPLGHPLVNACAMPVDGRDYYASELEARVGMTPPERAPTSFYVRRWRDVVRTSGARDSIEAVVTPRGRLVTRTHSNGRTVGLGNHGTALGVADIDHDGQVELVTSTDTLVGGGDELQVMRVLESGGLRMVWTSDALDGSVLVAGSGDLDADGTEALLAIEEPAAGRATLWIVR